MKTKNHFQRSGKIKKVFYFLLVMISSTFFFACSSDGGLGIGTDGPVISVSDFAGNWTATFAKFRNASNPSQEVDIILNGGSVTLSVQNSGRFTITINDPGQPANVSSGLLGFNEEEYGGSLIVLFDGDAEDDYELFNIQLVNSNNDMLLNGPTTFDFDGNGSEVAANADFEFISN